MSSLQKMKAGIGTLEKLSRLLEENPKQFEVSFSFHGEIPFSNLPFGYEMYGHAVVYPLLDGRRIWGTGRSLRYFMTRIDLATGEQEYQENPYHDIPTRRDIRDQYGFKGFVTERLLEIDKTPMPLEQYETLWKDAMQKIRGVFGEPVEAVVSTV